MPLYTFVLDYAGGTYLSQRMADNPNAAIKDWLAELVTSETAGGVSVEVYEAFQIDEDHVELTPLDGLSKVWCATGSADRDLALLNIVETSE